MDNKKIGKLIASLRKKQGLTQQQLGDKVGVGFRAVSKWERGINCPDIGIINDLSKILGISSDELLSGEIKEDNSSQENKPSKKKIPTKIKITISIAMILLLIVTSFFIYYNNKTYVYEIVGNNNEEYYIEGQVLFNKNDMTITINKIKFLDKKFSSIIIKGYDYQVKFHDNLLFGYGTSKSANFVDGDTTISSFAENFRINYNAETSIKRNEMLKSDILIKFIFIDENDSEIIKELKFSLYKQNNENNPNR